jgi:superfamily II DNA or RNA helicase
MSSLTLRNWQSQFVRAYRLHRGEDFLLVACPAAGKTIAAGAGVSEVMAARNADQLIIVAPTVVVRDQWATELAALGYKMLTRTRDAAWPEHVHGACVTYAQIAYRAEEFRAALARRRTVVVFDEVHHAGERKAWGDGISIAFEGAVSRLQLSGTPFRSDGTPIPFVNYGSGGTCSPDFAYDYPRAVADGVCRTVEFHPHDGRITWEEDDVERTAAFSDDVDDDARMRRLRASLDPQREFLQKMLAAANEDLVAMREEIPDAAGLVVCDTQAHALEVDRLLNEIAGVVPTLAISDLPRAHQAIAGFTDELDEWLVSVRMVSEGVDIPRLGVIVWATAASTELMVRQVAGRALRGRPEHGTHPARIHMPADPRLVEYAERLDVLAGAPRLPRRREDAGPSGPKRRLSRPPGRKGREIDPAPLVEWFDRQVELVGGVQVTSRLGMDHDTGTRAFHRWRAEGAFAHVLTLYDLCHAAGIDFDELFAGEKYEEARAFVAHPDISEGRNLNFGAIDALHLGVDGLIQPPLPEVPERRQAGAVPFEVATPDLPPSPEEIEEAEHQHRALRTDLYRLMNTYTQLRRHTDPGYQLAAVASEVAETFGSIDDDTPDEVLGEAIDWINERAAAIALENPDLVRELARAKRRHAGALAA